MASRRGLSSLLRIRDLPISPRQSIVCSHCLPRISIPQQQRRSIIQVLNSPKRPFRISWPIVAPIIILGTGTIAMIIWYYSSNEFLDAGFPPRAAEAFRIADVAAGDWQFRRAIKYYRLGIEDAISHGISPFDKRILWIKGKLMIAIKKEGDIGAERELLAEIREQAVQEIKAGNMRDRGMLVALAVKAALSLANSYQDEGDRETRYKEFLWAIRTLQHENQRQRALPNPPEEHWGWIPDKYDRSKLLKSVASFAVEVGRFQLALTYNLEALPVYPPDNPDSLDTMLHIARLVKKSTPSKNLTTEELIKQSDIWLNKIITIRPKIPRNLPPSQKYIPSKGSVDNTYTLWGWDRKCDEAYVSALWELGVNHRTLGKTAEAESRFDEAIRLCDELKMPELKAKLKKARLKLQGKVEEANNPYFWG